MFNKLNVFLLIIIISSMIVKPVMSQNLEVSMSNGERAFLLGDYGEAESIFELILELDSTNYHVLKSLAKTKMKLNKPVEAEKLVDRILTMPIVSGRDVLVFQNNKAEPAKAELIDKSVMAIDASAKAESLGSINKYVIRKVPEPTPHYRVYFKKTGKIKLLPHSRTSLKYEGIPQTTHKLALEMKDRIRKIIISEAKSEEEQMIPIKGGCFQMGSENGDPDEVPVHNVCVQSFLISKREVAQKNFQAIMGFNPSQNVGADFPVDSLTWDEANDYCRKTSRRLPTEAEWELAARGGKDSEFYWGKLAPDKHANFCDSTCKLNIREPRQNDGFSHTAPVGSFPPNPYGLQDMAGNVGEWVFDWMAENYYRQSPKNNPRGPNPNLDAKISQSITHKVYRGGAWNQTISELRSANRRASRYQLRAEGIGFRCANSS